MIEKIELIDAELDAVCGGLFNFGNVIAQINSATQNATAVGGSASSVPVARLPLRTCSVVSRTPA